MTDRTAKLIGGWPPSAATNQKIAKNYQEDLEAFLDSTPAYLETAHLDEIRASEFSRLDRQGHVYLDYTGGGLYGDCQIRRHSELLQDGVLGNPHSSNPSSRLSTELVERARHRVLEFFSASPDEYIVIFTANASHSLKLVGESYPFLADDRFLLTFDNHNSVNGIREFDRARGAETFYVPMTPPALRVEDKLVHDFLDQVGPNRSNLFAYPAQSNFSGVQHPLEWIDKAQGKGWDVLLDAAAFVPTNRLDLSRWKPDYLALSFYKMFGYPTGVGALIARPEALEKLHRPWFAGGTISVASVQADRHVMAHGYEAFEDGTPNYTNLPAIEIGLDFLERLGIEAVHERVACLTQWLLERMLELRHPTGVPLAKIYGPGDTDSRGGTIAFNFYDREGRVIDHQAVEARANEVGISLRTGCFCNPGAGELALGLSRNELEVCFADDGATMSYNDFRQCINSDSTGAVRVSVGAVSNFADVWSFIDLAKQFLGE